MSSITATSQPGAPLPADDPNRTVTVVDPDDPRMRHVFVASDTYTVLLTGADTGGRYCLLDFHVPPGGGPPPHRHDFEEMFTILEGEVELTFRGDTSTARTGTTVNIPANAPHSFKNVSQRPARMLCMCTPSGQEEFFMAIGDPADSRTATPPKLSQAEQAERGKAAKALAPTYRSEILTP